LTAFGEIYGGFWGKAATWAVKDSDNYKGKAVVAAVVICGRNVPTVMASGEPSSMTVDHPNLTNNPEKLNVALTASGLLELVSDSPAAVELAPGVRTTRFIPVEVFRG
ncbi:hypothetical protein KCA24_35940, partial [Escherichia coli]|nr:hypothetical protein [Escherichia coli]